MVRLVTCIEDAESVSSDVGLEACCLNRPYDRYDLIQVREVQSRELDSELRKRLGLARRLLGRHNIEESALPQWNQGSYCTFTSGVYGLYELI